MADEVQTHSAPPEPKGRRRQVAHLIRHGVPLAVLLVVLAGVYVYWTQADHAPAPAQAAGPQGPMPVNAIVVEPQDVPMETRYLAQTEASQSVEIRARVSGFLLERTFEEGQRVEEGQVLYRIDPEPFEVTLQQANAQLAAAQARLQRAAQQVERFETLATQQSAAAQELEQWQEELQVAAAEVESQKARIAQAELDLGYTTINSPITGLIGESLQDVGSYLSPTGNSHLATVQQVDPIYVRYSVSEQDLLRTQRLTQSGQLTDIPLDQVKVEVILPDGEVYPYTGQISYVDVAIDPSTGTALMRATVPNPDHLLRRGQFVHVRLSGVERLGAILVPLSAVMQSPTGSNVYVIDEKGTVQIRPVTLGEWYGDNWIVESGLEAGDRVIIDHLMQVQPNMPVAPTFVSLAQPSPTTTPATQPATQPGEQPDRASAAVNP